MASSKPFSGLASCQFSGNEAHVKSRRRPLGAFPEREIGKLYLKFRAIIVCPPNFNLTGPNISRLTRLCNPHASYISRVSKAFYNSRIPRKRPAQGIRLIPATTWPQVGRSAVRFRFFPRLNAAAVIRRRAPGGVGGSGAAFLLTFCKMLTIFDPPDACFSSRKSLTKSSCVKPMTTRENSVGEVEPNDLWLI